MAIKKIICLALLVVSELMAAQTISRYEYWLGNDHSSKWTVRSSQQSITFSIPTQNIGQGLQMLNFRVMNSDGDWSPIQRMLFCLPDATETEATVAKYEWWVDNNVNSRRTSQTFSANISGLNVGMHCLNVRVCNSNGNWSPIQRMLFYIPDEAEKEATIADYEWWIDDDVQSRNTSKTISVVTNRLSTGIHCLNIRVRNSNGDWSPIQRFLFFIPDEAEAQAEMAEIEYWINEDYSKAVNEHSAMRTYNMPIDISSYEVGVHTLNFRAKNSNGAWSTPSRFLFYVPDTSDETDSPYNGYYYSFNEKLSFVSMPEQQEIDMRNLVIAIPDLTEIGNVDNGCTFSINAKTNNVCMTRTQPVNFAMWFTKRDGTKSAAATTTFSMSDELYRSIEPFSVGLSRTIDRPDKGDFHAFCFNVLYEQDITFTSSVPCKLRLFDGKGSVISATSMTDSWHFALPVGTYYGVISNSTFANTSNDDKLTYSLIPTILLQDEDDDLQRYLNSLFDTEDMVVETTYTRLFLNTDWQTLYVPFSISLNNLTGFDVAKIKGCKEYDDESDGNTDRYAIEAIAIETGYLQPNTPYLIRAKETGIYTFDVNAAQWVDKQIVPCTYSTKSATVTITGNYSNLSGMKTARRYRIMGGALNIPESDSEVLPPYRWYMTLGTIANSRQNMIEKLQVHIMAGTDETTEINSLPTSDNCFYDLQGRKVVEDKLRKGLYIINGRKYVVK